MNTQSTEKKRSPRADVIVISVLLLAAIIAVGATLLLRKEGAYARVEIDGETVASYPLSVNGEYPLRGGTNILIIENGEAYLSYADCPDKTCVSTGRIKYRGQSIICLPNKVAVVIDGETDGGVDFVS